MSKWITLLLVLLSCGLHAQAIVRQLPPAGIELSDAQRQEVILARDHLAERLVEIPEAAPRRADLEIYHKAISYAVEFGEFYRPKDLEAVRLIVAAADARADELASGAGQRHGMLVRGYRSSIDGSVQPYGLEVPEGLDLRKPVPLWVWLHGRGDKETDLHFITGRLGKPGQFRPDNAIVLHPFGRQCIGWKSAGEIDVFEAIDDVARRYEIDRDRIALMGFSMGGAGAWHIGAHYTDRFAIVHAGAGFAETAEYNRLERANYPASYEQTLWRLYDVPNYVRNFFNVPLVAYSGELDKQIQAARVMERALAAEGKELKHLIGPEMGHQYDPQSRKEIEGIVRAAVAEGRAPARDTIHLQTQTLRYNRMHWISATGLEEHWQDSRIDASRRGGKLEISTKNMVAFSMEPPGGALSSLTVDGVQLQVPDGAGAIHLYRTAGTWRLGQPPENRPRKRPGLQGPIDDVFLAPFMLVLPTSTPANVKVGAWVEAELGHFEQRWRATFRGELKRKRADQLTPEDHVRFHLIAFGDPASNPIIANAVASWSDLSWDLDTLEIGDCSLPAASHLPLMIRPNPGNPKKYLVINSGPTFREGHDRTNSLQNPKLPDWALINLDQAPDDTVAGKVIAADFFDEGWQLKRRAGE
jgi:predicted esterase